MGPAVFAMQIFLHYLGPSLFLKIWISVTYFLHNVLILRLFIGCKELPEANRNSCKLICHNFLKNWQGALIRAWSGWGEEGAFIRLIRQANICEFKPI